MVLPELGGPSGSNGNGDRDSFTDGAPTSDSDPYASTTSFDQPPNSFPVQQPNSPTIFVSKDKLATYRVSGATLAKLLTDDIGRSSRLLRRPLTSDEVNALAEHDAKMIQITNTWGDVGLGFALYQFIKGRRTRSFPLWKPDASTNFNAMGPLNGRPARFLWFTARFFAWSAAGQLVALTGATVQHSATTFPRRFLDPRLKEINEAMRIRRPEGSGAMRTPDMTPGPRPGETTEMARQREQIQRQQRIRQRQQEQQQQTQTSSSLSYDDMSPTSGAFSRDIYGTRSTSVADFASDAEVERQYESPSASTSSTSPSYTNSSSNTPPSSPANRTAEASAPSSTATSAQQPPQAGSAWDRLRQEALSGTKPPPSSRQQPSAPPQKTGDSTFWQTDDDKQRADAQREFDARIERERAGGDFNDSPKGKGGWP